KTVVMCTHLLAEAEGLADHIVVMEAGHALCTGTPDELTERYLPAATVVLDAEAPDQLDRLAHMTGVIGYDRTDVARIELDGFGRVPDLVLSLARDGVRLTRVEPHVPTLEDLYFAVRRERAELLAGRPLPTLDTPDPQGFGRANVRAVGVSTTETVGAGHEEVSA
ncbi:MAG TPA: hypothetical protein PLS46_17475, partial [Microthrixaceae bacterium]|nr:hypothetical protein [Microthrixaceae bacterium]